MKITLDTAEILERAKAKLDDTYTLAYASYDDELSDEQIAKALKGEAPDDTFDNWESDARHYYAREIAKDLVASNVEWAALEDSEEFFELIDEIKERDDSDLWSGVLRNTPSKLFRYALTTDERDLDPDSWNWDDHEVETAARSLAGLAGVDYAAHAEQFTELVQNATYGGRLYVIWYTDPAPLIEAALAHDPDNPDHAERTLSVTNPCLVLLDVHNGSGHDVKLDGVTVTTRFDPERLVLDSQDWGYSWDAVCGLVKSAYEADSTITTTEESA